MRVLALAALIALVGQRCLTGAPPPPQTPYHVLLGPYDYELTREQMARYDAVAAKRYKTLEARKAARAALPRPKREPRFYTLDDKHYTSIPLLEAAVAALPPGATVYLRGSCERHTAIELPPRPISLEAFQAFCSSHHITFTWTFGPGGY